MHSRATPENIRVQYSREKRKRVLTILSLTSLFMMAS
jgi:hypothetical protein